MYFETMTTVWEERKRTILPTPIVEFSIAVFLKIIYESGKMREDQKSRRKKEK